MDKLYYILISIIVLIIIIITYYFFECIFINDTNCSKSIHNNKSIIIEKFDFDNYNLPKIIWAYWNDKNTIPICIQNILKNNTSVIKEWKINFLTDEALSEYIPNEDLPSFKDVKVVQKSDWIRLYLLEKYGGCWLDAGIIINDEKAFYKLRDDSIKKQSLFTGFYFGKYVKDNKFCHVENSFIMVPKGSSIIKAWRKEFEKAINMGFYNYKKSVKKNKKLKLRNIYRHIGDVYMTAYACFYNISEYFNKSIKEHIILYDARDSMFKLQEQCGWYNNVCIHKKLNNKKAKNIPYIKLTNSHRKRLTLNNYHLPIGTNSIN
jgi:hypothetical protein